ncbi:MAG: electron transfer flavoprotein subunit beta/FixA family protein [Lentisphaeria bacterium]|nr:electron transfer flavoprotein subunit beta/FixA family protein [Lentisphaeria bacterium]
MSYTILVFVKQVPDTKNVTGEAMKPDGTVNRAALPAIFNPEDLNALELALELKDRYQAKVVVATMGLPAASAVLRDSLCRGADEAILLTDRAFAGADTLATSFSLSRLAKRLGKFDLILCGRQAIDGDTAQVGPQIAEKLNLPQICYVEEVISLSETSVRARRTIEGGYEILEAPLPALMTVVDANEPRPRNAERILKYRKAKTPSEFKAAGVDEAGLEALAAKGLVIQEWTAAGTIPENEMNRIGKAGSPTNVKQIMSVVLTAGDYKNIEPSTEGVTALIHELIEDHTLG